MPIWKEKKQRHVRQTKKQNCLGHGHGYERHSPVNRDTPFEPAEESILTLYKARRTKRVCVYIYIYIYIRILYTYRERERKRDVCMYVCMYVCVYIYIDTCIYIYIYIYTYMYTYMYVSLSLYIYAYIHMYVHIHVDVLCNICYKQATTWHNDQQ